MFISQRIGFTCLWENVNAEFFNPSFVEKVKWLAMI